MTSPATAAPPTVSRQNACERLHIGERRLRGLIAGGRLEIDGQGHSVRITLESLEAELARKEIRKSRRPKSGNLGASSKPFPNFFNRHLVNDSHEAQSENVLLNFHRVEKEPPVAKLLSIARAAAMVGICDETLRAAVDSGQVPVVEVGKRRRINAEVLRVWARGGVKKGSE